MSNLKRLTVDTITDEQIRELRSFEQARPEPELDLDLIVACVRALGESYGTDEVSRLLYSLHSAGEVHRCRARCAEVLNARASAKNPEPDPICLAPGCGHTAHRDSRCRLHLPDEG